MKNLVYLGYLFPLFFIGIWVFATYIISKMGWEGLATHYKTDEEFIGKRIGLISAKINNANYNNSLILKCNNEGIYLKPIFIFRLFHDPIFIPWKAISEVREKQILFFDFKDLIIGNPLIAVIRIRETTFSKMEKGILGDISK